MDGPSVAPARSSSAPRRRTWAWCLGGLVASVVYAAVAVLAILVHVGTIVPFLAGAAALIPSGARLGRLAVEAEEVEHGTA